MLTRPQSLARLLAEANSPHLALMRYLSQVTHALGVGEHVYVVGGAVRNFVLGQPIKDIDIVIDSVALKGKDSEWLAKQLQKEIPAATNLTTNQYGVAILTVKGDWELEGFPLKGEVIEIANAREESYGAGGKGYKPSEVKAASIAADVKRREFTFNTLMWRLADLAHGPEKADIVDITGCGLADLKAGQTRCPSDPDKTFSDDPTRMLRAIKFLVKYGFKVEGEVAASIRRNARQMLNAPHEAISTLLINTILHEPTAVTALKAMDRLGLLAVVAEMLATNREFSATMANWAANKKVAFLFDLLDHGLPLGTPLDFLKPEEQKRLRQAAATLPSGQAEELLAALKQPGKALGDKAFVPKLAAEKGVPQSAMKDWAPKVTLALRAALLDDPSLLKRPDLLQAIARSVPAPKTEDVEYRGKTFPGYNKPVRSDRPEKKKMVLAKKGDKVKLVHFGQKGYRHNYSAKAKKNYLARSAGIRKKDGSKTKDDKFSANYWARRVLWPKGKKPTAESIRSRMEALLDDDNDD